jgi:hypothetical protein
LDRLENQSTSIAARVSARQHSIEQGAESLRSEYESDRFIHRMRTEIDQCAERVQNRLALHILDVRVQGEHDLQDLTQRQAQLASDADADVGVDVGQRQLSCDTSLRTSVNNDQCRQAERGSTRCAFFCFNLLVRAFVADHWVAAMHSRDHNERLQRLVLLTAAGFRAKPKVQSDVAAKQMAQSQLQAISALIDEYELRGRGIASRLDNVELLFKVLAIAFSCTTVRAHCLSDDLTRLK